MGKGYLNAEGDEKLQPFDWQSLAEQPVVGLDEVGRGCLAGPVYAAAAIVRPGCAESLNALGVTDSKLLSESKRERLFPTLFEMAWIGLGSATAQEIDRINILQATFLAMRRALDDLRRNVDGLPLGSEDSLLGSAPGHLLIDGNQRLPLMSSSFEEQTLRAPVDWSRWLQTPVIKGDLRALPIAVASIAAKVTRDRLMVDLSKTYPGYGFEKHKGYAAPIHRKAIEEIGPIEIHRKSFGGVREFIRP